MRVLLFLNGPEGWQTGIEDGFTYLKTSGVIESLRWLYLEDYAKNNGVMESFGYALKTAREYQPDLIVIFHIGKLPVTVSFLTSLRNIDSKPVLAYDEGDMYGTWAKPISRQMKTTIKHVDVVSVRGLGKFADNVRRLNQNIIYTPHHADIARFDSEPFLHSDRNLKLVLIGNRVAPRRLARIRRIPGATERERFVRDMGKTYGDEFILYGSGWGGFVGNRGVLDFQKQLEVYRESWITVAYEHYPDIPYYFSNRLPLALMAGSLYVCHYHKGYENIFRNCDFIFFFESSGEAIDIINYIYSLGVEELKERSARAREFSLKHFHPNAAWLRFFRNVTRVTLDANR